MVTLSDLKNKIKAFYDKAKEIGMKDVGETAKKVSVTGLALANLFAFYSGFKSYNAPYPTAGESVSITQVEKTIPQETFDKLYDEEKINEGGNGEATFVRYAQPQETMLPKPLSHDIKEDDSQWKIVKENLPKYINNIQQNIKKEIANDNDVPESQVKINSIKYVIGDQTFNLKDLTFSDRQVADLIKFIQSDQLNKNVKYLNPDKYPESDHLRVPGYYPEGSDKYVPTGGLEEGEDGLTDSLLPNQKKMYLGNLKIDATVNNASETTVQGIKTEKRFPLTPFGVPILLDLIAAYFLRKKNGVPVDPNNEQGVLDGGAGGDNYQVIEGGESIAPGDNYQGIKEGESIAPGDNYQGVEEGKIPLEPFEVPPVQESEQQEERGLEGVLDNQPFLVGKNGVNYILSVYFSEQISGNEERKLVNEPNDSLFKLYEFKKGKHKKLIGEFSPVTERLTLYTNVGELPEGDYQVIDSILEYANIIPNKDKGGPEGGSQSGPVGGGNAPITPTNGGGKSAAPLEEKIYNLINKFTYSSPDTRPDNLYKSFREETDLSEEELALRLYFDERFAAEGGFSKRNGSGNSLYMSVEDICKLTNLRKGDLYKLIERKKESRSKIGEWTSRKEYLNQLREERRENVYNLYENKELSAKDIAEELGVSVSTVYRDLKKMKSQSNKESSQESRGSIEYRLPVSMPPPSSAEIKISSLYIN